jgi:hypothetical protein
VSPRNACGPLEPGRSPPAIALQPHRVESFKLSKDPRLIEKIRDIVGTALPLVSCALGLALLVATNAAPIPGGSTGIASRYPGDVGIASDPNVIFADDFESYGGVSGLTSRWNEAYHTSNIRIATESGNFFGGGKALEFTVRQTSKEVSNSAMKYVSPERDVLFLRYYAKFDERFNVLGSSHNGSTISSRYCCPGVPADGYNKFLISYEAWRGQTVEPNPGKLNVYMYHPDQRDVWGDHFFPTGIVSPFTRVPFDFGPDFVALPDVTPVLGRWYCYELMVKTNAPGQRNGRIALWLDGNLIADFPNLRIRETTALKIDRFTIGLHVKANTLGVAREWYDNVVAATSYIGPMASSTSIPLRKAPTGLPIVP